jgi:hypothetical protein
MASQKTQHLSRPLEMSYTRFDYNSVKSVMNQILNSDDKGFEEKFKLTWIYLNKHVHPSAKQMDMVAKEDFSSFVTDSFNQNLAKATLKVVNEIFDLVYVIVFKKFSRIKKLALGYKFISEWEEYLPNTMSIMKSVS